MSLGKYFGPSTLVAAAFIGPGTLTVCTLAGVETGYELLWVLAFSIVCTIILQEMSARLGLATQRGLGEAIRKEFPGGPSRWLVFFLVIGAILVGNAAYEAGNISGGNLGLELLVGEAGAYPWLIGVPCALLLFLGGYRWVERLLIGLVVLMSACFLLTTVLVQPDFGAILAGFVPSFPSGDRLLLLMAVVGTTVVPYNLFLHASTVSKKHGPEASLRDLRIENAVAVTLGGLISVLIVITAAASSAEVGSVKNAADLAVQLEPAFGSSARVLMGVGLLAAGLSSALTAPLAAAYAARGLFGWPADDRDPRFRAVWAVILLIGIGVATSGLRPLAIIRFAQVTNALLLPAIAVYLLYLANSRSVMGRHVNSRLANILGGLVILVTLGLAARTFVLLLN
ncbi:Nramp family divalent metal transporter [Lewinella sp. 4G2]|uniref:Nramp family divalent metal transporter n=1 Tax=Lewinella sp. 4G2 TaxID=1803372 RepID=UPI0007B45F53|nr:Nramp family divalent metal transporter [Lewinella sp. 4G2]OAV43643.1 manganese transporter [Lewinella sp. 4G2]